MADNNGALITHGSVGTTAETSYLTEKCLQVAVTNKHATQTLGVRVFTAASAAAAAALADATDAVEGADENWYIPPAGGRRVVFRSPKPTFVALSVVGSGATTTYVVNGTNFHAD
jgi:hypothetical protein